MTTTAEAPLLKHDDLDDPDQFVEVGPIPYIDVHDDPTNGKVDERILRLLRDNNNRRCRRGLYTALILGHTKLPQKAGDHMPDEVEQPQIIGYAGQFFIAPDPVEGKPCLWATEWHRRGYAQLARTFPYRSIERLAPAPDKENPSTTDHYSDRVSLLRTPPRREFPPIHYGGDPEDSVRLAYGRVAPATEPEKEPEGKENEMAFDHTNPAHVEELARHLGPHLGKHVRDHVRSALQEMVEPHSNGDHEEPDGDEPEQATLPPAKKKAAPKPPVDEEPDGDEADDVAPEDDGGDEDVPDVLPDEGDDGYDDDEDDDRSEYAAAEDVPADGDTCADYEGEDGEEVDEDMRPPKKMRAKYDAAEAPAEVGGHDSLIPKLEPAKPRRKKVIDRKQYQKDMGAVALTIEDLYEQIGQITHERNRLLYAQTLEGMKKEGFELDVEEEVAELPVDEPEQFMERRQTHIRKHYRRSIMDQPTVPVGEHRMGPKPRMTDTDRIKAVGYATAHKVSYDAAIKALGLDA